MADQGEQARLSAREFAAQVRREMVPLSNTCAYFAALPLGEEDMRGYLEEPTAALPPAAQSLLGGMFLLLVPYLELGPRPGEEQVSFDKPAPRREAWAAQFSLEGQAAMVFAIKEQQAPEYHYVFYRAVATLVEDFLPEDARERFLGLLREELRNGVAGEVDQGGWELKQALRRRQKKFARDSKLFRDYARQAFIDTLTLYFHGICCDIDVEAGPRQLPSRHLRKRLDLFFDLFPPPQGYAVFPEQLSAG
ncbi:MAG: hypothetical protein FJW34_01985 [Acidobacteria bacterium]|nr:hypothetical protein [Acidobacteriota bacterium]